MKNHDFEKIDERWMKDLKEIREKKVPEKILDGFAASVEARIREDKRNVAAKAYDIKPKRFLVPVFAPTFAVLIIGSVLVLRSPLATRPEAVPQALTRRVSEKTTSDNISEEVAVLREVGAWTEEDEAAAGVSSDAGLSDIELCQNSSQKTRFLA